MTEKYYAPKAHQAKFHCPQCGVYAIQYWGYMKSFNRYGYDNLSDNMSTAYRISKCSHCEKYLLWHDDKLIYPRSTSVELPNEDLTEEIKELYSEAALILTDSPRAAAALLRLALQLLLKELGGKGKHIDTDIKTIVAGGVDPQVQKAMDIVRVFGNNGAHPGEIQLNEDPELVKKMFELINYIATKMITSKKEIDTLFDGLPDGIKGAIDKRDSKEDVK